MRQLLTPASIALTIWDVTRLYTSSFSDAVFSFVDIVKPPFAVFRNRQVFRLLAGSDLHRQINSRIQSEQAP